MTKVDSIQTYSVSLEVCDREFRQNPNSYVSFGVDHFNSTLDMALVIYAAIVERLNKHNHVGIFRLEQSGKVEKHPGGEIYTLDVSANLYEECEALAFESVQARFNYTQSRFPVMVGKNIYDYVMIYGPLLLATNCIKLTNMTTGETVNYAYLVDN